MNQTKPDRPEPRSNYKQTKHKDTQKHNFTHLNTYTPAHTGSTPHAGRQGQHVGPHLRHGVGHLEGSLGEAAQILLLLCLSAGDDDGRLPQPVGLQGSANACATVADLLRDHHAVQTAQAQAAAGLGDVCVHQAQLWGGRRGGEGQGEATITPRFKKTVRAGGEKGPTLRFHLLAAGDGTLGTVMQSRVHSPPTPS